VKLEDKRKTFPERSIISFSVKIGAGGHSWLRVLIVADRRCDDLSDEKRLSVKMDAEM
jgi:hypothetical protein